MISMYGMLREELIDRDLSGKYIDTVILDSSAFCGFSRKDRRELIHLMVDKLHGIRTGLPLDRLTIYYKTHNCELSIGLFDVEAKRFFEPLFLGYIGNRSGTQSR